ncbi:MAG: porin [Pseudarcicella sp.]|nr:porin [Pseudarcicella sp.]MBP6409927.1 porin [Pseudarcicella sp.]
MKNLILSAIMLVSTFISYSQVSSASSTSTTTETKKETSSTKKWYDKISLRGYAQVRYNRLLETNSKLKCDQCDKSIGENGGFFLRRGRLIFSGDVSDRLYIYLQPDFASAAEPNQHYFQLRDAYFDLALDEKKEFRFRVGQSKVPYGFENMQSSQNRLALDRNDALNSAVSNERDLGVFAYFAPAKIRERFAHLVKSGLKGSGDYGVVGLGAYNGQTANKPEANNNTHVVARVTYPFMLKSGQFIEGSLQGFTGQTTIAIDGKNKNPNLRFKDQRAAATLVVYPQPFGFQAEYNVGTGPEFNPDSMKTLQTNLHGGYAQIMYKTNIGTNNTLIPFVKYQVYNGGKKFETDARKYRVNDLEIGVEWQLKDYFELVAMYTIAKRRYEDAKVPKNYQEGELLRLQAQFNF